MTPRRAGDWSSRNRVLSGHRFAASSTVSSIASRPEDKQGLLVITRKENETIDIGDEITVQGMELANGGVKLGISAPKHVHVSRGDGKVTPLCETKRQTNG